MYSDNKKNCYFKVNYTVKGKKQTNKKTGGDVEGKIM